MHKSSFITSFRSALGSMGPSKVGESGTWASSDTVGDFVSLKDIVVREGECVTERYGVSDNGDKRQGRGIN